MPVLRSVPGPSAQAGKPSAYRRIGLAWLALCLLLLAGADPGAGMWREAGPPVALALLWSCALASLRPWRGQVARLWVLAGLTSAAVLLLIHQWSSLGHPPALADGLMWAGLAMLSLRAHEWAARHAVRCPLQSWASRGLCGLAVGLSAGLLAGHGWMGAAPA
ncbi:hypothetical protein [Ideonella livida]|uniref:Uncharacterized protein n=1 Tax=Ideonella livida TaxID=2707176 RepID=A0A7C9PIT2_9BURK|nr:hypothetical protein [Ideonella livida]NDY92271.1 hypothetical protein [Ideonella livida]